MAAAPVVRAAPTLISTSRRILAVARRTPSICCSPPGWTCSSSTRLAGRVAVGGRLLFEHDQVARVRWEAMTRKIYFDELPRITRSHREFAAAVTARAR
jgi:hypothetical protein